MPRARLRKSTNRQDIRRSGISTVIGPQVGGRDLLLGRADSRRGLVGGSIEVTLPPAGRGTDDRVFSASLQTCPSSAERGRRMTTDSTDPIDTHTSNLSAS